MSDDAKDSVLLPLELQNLAQQTSKCCWYACYQMMYIWNKRTLYDLDKNLTDAGYNLRELLGLGPNPKGLDPSQYGPICQAVGFVGVSIAAAMTWSMDDVIFRLNKWGPIWVATDKYDGHAMVLYGADSKTGHLTLADPYTPATEGSPFDAHYAIWTLDYFKTNCQPWHFSLQVFA